MRTQNLIQMKKSEHLIIAAAILFAGCSAKNPPENYKLPTIGAKEDFNSYWFAGKGELAHYDLQQARYGEIHEGEAVFVFVTEEMLLDEQVKFESGEGDKTPVMKLNGIRRFKTGIYDYSLMRSVFTPVDNDTHPHTLKVSHTSQDWCGHAFTQINRRDDQYELQQFSYFQHEGDRSFTYPVGILEDELWTRIRLGDKIPLGKQHLIPALDHIRLSHKAPKNYEASIEQSITGDMTTTVVRYTQLDRVLTIKSETAFPHRIMEWQEEVDDFGVQAVTKAKLTHIRNSPYWSEHKKEHEALRKELGLKWE